MTARDDVIEQATKAICEARWNYALPHANPGGLTWTDADLARAVYPVIRDAVLEEAAEVAQRHGGSDLEFQSAGDYERGWMRGARQVAATLRALKGGTE